MRALSVFFKTLRDLRWQVFWYGTGIALIAALDVLIYPSYKEQLADFDIPEALRALVGDVEDFASPEGFLTAEFFSWVPILAVIFAVMAGTNLLGGEETNGTLDLLLAQPISRSRLLLEKLAGFVADTLGILTLTNLGWLLTVPFVDIDVSLGKLVVATFALAPLPLVFGAFALWAGVAMPSRGQATGVAAAVAVATFVINYLATLVDVLAPAAWLSPFKYSNTSGLLTEGVDWPKLAVLVVLFVLFTLLALRAFAQRDIGIRASDSWLGAIFARLKLRDARA
jgi:ABC-2 type transport system permease protein